MLLQPLGVHVAGTQAREGAGRLALHRAHRTTQRFGCLGFRQPLVVTKQYNRALPIVPEFGPYPGKVTNDRITDENAAVRVLEPGNPVFNVPNKITAAAWAGWVQERGLNFFSGDPTMRLRC